MIAKKGKEHPMASDGHGRKECEMKQYHQNSDGEHGFWW